ncbi:hypothetical protein [Desulfobulbus sp.]|uniref:hypothetical protein n=1 Tax=Desulfobulbus sp. TaxID=895 RepID=UPI0027BADD52|nr:hypothetical protein [Desulfobulbus sp.]
MRDLPGAFGRLREHPPQQRNDRAGKCFRPGRWCLMLFPLQKRTVFACPIKARSLPSVEMTEKERWPRDKTIVFQAFLWGCHPDEHSEEKSQTFVGKVLRCASLFA